MSEGTYDSAGYNIDDVKTHVGENPDQLDAVLESEKARGDDARVTLVEWLEAEVASRPKPVTQPPVDNAPTPDTARIAGDEYSVDPNKGYRIVAGGK